MPPKTPKKPITGGMKVRDIAMLVLAHLLDEFDEDEVLLRAVEEGYRYGWHRAHKHSDNPAAEYLEDQVVLGILNEIWEVFDFDE